MTSPPVQAVPAALDRASRQIGSLHDDLVELQGVLAREVDQLLDARWSGAAASQFRTAWAQWCRGIHDVLVGVGMEGNAIELVRAEVTGVDAARADAVARLHARLDAS